MLQVLYSPTAQACDLGRSGKNLLTDPTLLTAVTISLFSRRLAETSDILPDPKGDRQGWWADKYSQKPGRLWGSRLWLLSRSKAPLPEVATLAAVYGKEALAWMVEDLVAARVDFLASWQTIPATTAAVVSTTPLLALQPLIYKPGSPNPWTAVWLASLAIL